MTGKFEIKPSNEFECSQRQQCSDRDEMVMGPRCSRDPSPTCGYPAKQRHSNGYNSRGKPQAEGSGCSRKATETKYNRSKPKKSKKGQGEARTTSRVEKKGVAERRCWGAVLRKCWRDEVHEQGESWDADRRREVWLEWSVWRTRSNCACSRWWKRRGQVHTRATPCHTKPDPSQSRCRVWKVSFVASED